VLPRFTSVLQCVAVCYSVSQCSVFQRYSVLQCVAVCLRNGGEQTDSNKVHVAVCCSVVQCVCAMGVVVCCNGCS